MNPSIRRPMRVVTVVQVDDGSTYVIDMNRPSEVDIDTERDSHYEMSFGGRPDPRPPRYIVKSTGYGTMTYIEDLGEYMRQNPTKPQPSLNQPALELEAGE